MDNTKPTNLLLVDDHHLYREGLARIIGTWDDFVLLGECENGAEAVEFCRHTQPDMILMDIQMPMMNGVEATGVIHREFPHIPIIMLTVSSEDALVFDAITSGASGYILKNVHSKQLHGYLAGVLRGETPLSGEVSTRLVAEFRRQRVAAGQEHSPSSWESTLSERELEIIRMVAQGQSNDAIAKQLFFSEALVKKQLMAIMHKLNVENRVQLAVFAVQHGMIN